MHLSLIFSRFASASALSRSRGRPLPSSHFRSTTTTDVRRAAARPAQRCSDDDALLRPAVPAIRPSVCASATRTSAQQRRQSDPSCGGLRAGLTLTRLASRLNADCCLPPHTAAKYLYSLELRRASFARTYVCTSTPIRTIESPHRRRRRPAIFIHHYMPRFRSSVTVHVQARIYRLLRAPSSIFPPHGHRFQSRSRARSHAVQATLYISTRPVCSAEASHELPRRHRHAARRSSRRVFSLSSSPSSIRDRQAYAGGWIRYFSARV